MVTVAQIVNEYKNRQANPVFSMITVMGIDCLPATYPNPTNIEQTHDNNWLEFDSKSEYRERIQHIRVLSGHITKYVEDI